MPLNDGNNHHHGGPDGFAFRVWSIGSVSDTAVTLKLHSPDGDQGYPGNMDVGAEFVPEENTRILRHGAVSDADTLCSLTSHGYFNLSGYNTGNAMNQHLLLFAHAYTPSNAEGIPTGKAEWVEKTPIFPDYRLKPLIPIILLKNGVSGRICTDVSMFCIRKSIDFLMPEKYHIIER